MNKRYVFVFILLFLLLLSFVIMFFYFNLASLIIVGSLIIIGSILYLISGSEEEKEIINTNREYDLEDLIQEKDDEFMLDLFYFFVKEVIKLIGKSYSISDTSILDKFVNKDYIELVNNNINNYKENNYNRTITNIKFNDIRLDDYYVNKGYEYYELYLNLSKVDCFCKDGVVVTSDVSNGRNLRYKCVMCKKKGEKKVEEVNKCPICGENNINHGKCIDCGYMVNNLYGYYLIKFEELD